MGGHRFQTTRSLLTKVQGSLLSLMFDPESSIPPSKQEADGAYFIEEDPEAFRVILCWLRHQSLNLTPNVSLSYLINSANYFGLTELETAAKNQQKLEEQQKKEQKGKIVSISNDIAEITSSLRRVKSGIDAINEKLVTGVKCQYSQYYLQKT